MALIGDIYLFVENESVNRSTTASQHPMEEGIGLTDHVRRSPLTLSLSGEIAGEGYEDSVSQLERMQRDGELVKYVGVNILQDALITTFTTNHSSGVCGGCKFSMELKEIRIAASPFVAGGGNSAAQQIEQVPEPEVQEPPARTHTVKSGDTLWGISKSYYGNGASYPQIFEANRDKLSDPNKIWPGQVLTIP